VRRFGEIASEEYRALGIATALSPQIDLATDPRWSRFSGTFGENARLSSDMARAYCDGFQTSEGESALADGWGYQSVNAMVKHWPGGGAGEGGRDAHFAFGKFAVYPGKNFDEALIPFTEGAFKLDGPTKCASAVMPYYTISFGQDVKYGENVGNSYSRYIIGDLLRERYGFDGVVCTDWGITIDNPAPDSFGTTSWGVYHLNENERHYKALLAGIDQFGGNNKAGPILAAYRMGCAARGESFMRARMEASAVRLLRNMFRTGLFENPYCDVARAKAVVGNPIFMQAGYEAQKKSIVLLKNENRILPMKRCKVYIPQRYRAAGKNMFGMETPENSFPAVDRKIVVNYYDIAKTPEEADFAVIFMDSPASAGYDRDRGGYLPITLQYRPYTADTARTNSLGYGDPYDKNSNRSYKGRTNTASNEADLDILLQTRKAMGTKPVIVVLNLKNPTVMKELEPFADAMLVSFECQAQAVFDILSGADEPTGLLPCQLPADMETVEAQLEDVPRDMVCYTDSCGNTYDFAFGLNWSGVISDGRVNAYKNI
jgi:beta-glucosidase